MHNESQPPSTKESLEVPNSLSEIQSNPSSDDKVVMARVALDTLIIELLMRRWSADKVNALLACNVYSPEDKNDPYFGVLQFIITCKDNAEAVLIAEMIEMILARNYQIKRRVLTQLFPVRFEEKDPLNSQMTLTLEYSPEDYLRINERPTLDFDTPLISIFNDPSKDYYDYYALRYKVLRHKIRQMRDAKSPDKALEIRPVLQKAAEEVINDQQVSVVEPLEFNARILVVTAIVLGLGNYMHARRVIETLCRKMPNLQIDWILADYELPLPETESLPSQVTLHQSSMLYQQFPLIQHLSLQADAIIGLPNNFLHYLQKQLPKTPMILSSEHPYLRVEEYNIEPLEASVVNPLYDVDLRSGLNCKATSQSFGIIKPDFLKFSVERSEKRAVLEMDNKGAIIFADNPEVSLYFAYVYAPKPYANQLDVRGLRNIEVLALFIQHAKRKAERHIKVILTIQIEDIQKAKELYPTIFTDCAIQLHSQREQAQTVFEEGQLVIQVYSLFPFENTMFRALSDYASSCNTPVVMTGDQSLIELFFTANDDVVALYQLLAHKAALFDAMKEIAQENELVHFAQLLTQITNRIASEEQLIFLADSVFEHYEALKAEFRILKSIIQAQPDLVDSLTRVIPTVIETNRRLLQEKESKKVEAIIKFGEQFDIITEEFSGAEESIALLMSLDDFTDPTLCLETLLTEYYLCEPLFAPLTRHDPELFTDVFIYLIQLNEKILFLPMIENKPQETFIELLLAEEKNYSKVYEWLEQNKPEILRPQQKEFKNLQTLQEKIMNLCYELNYENIPTLLEGKSAAQLCKILCMNSDEILEDFLMLPIGPGEVLALKSFIDRGVIVLDLSFQEDTLLDYLCKKPLPYLPLLRFIQDRYKSRLSKYQTNILKKALEDSEKAQESKTVTVAPKLESKAKPLIVPGIVARFTEPTSPFQIDNPELVELIDTDSNIESIVLDAFIHKKLYDPLMEKGILVLPTQRSTEAISLGQLNKVKTGAELPFTVGIEVIGGQVEAMIAEKKCPRPNYIVCPINIEDLVHFRVLILELGDLNRPISAARAYYIEPLKRINKVIHYALNGRLSHMPQEHTPEGRAFVNDNFYRDYVEQLNSELNIDPALFQYIHLAQEPNERYCSDYVLSILMLLASGEINLANPESLIALEGKCLTKADSQAIRLLAIQQFGETYLRWQLKDNLKTENNFKQISEIQFPRKSVGTHESPEQNFKVLLESPQTLFASRCGSALLQDVSRSGIKRRKICREAEANSPEIKRRLLDSVLVTPSPLRHGKNAETLAKENQLRAMQQENLQKNKEKDTFNTWEQESEMMMLGANGESGIATVVITSEYGGFS